MALRVFKARLCCCNKLKKANNDRQKNNWKKCFKRKRVNIATTYLKANTECLISVKSEQKNYFSKKFCLFFRIWKQSPWSITTGNSGQQVSRAPWGKLGKWVCKCGWSLLTGTSSFKHKETLYLPLQEFYLLVNFHRMTVSESAVAQLCPTLCDPMDSNLPGSAIYGIFQARILEWAAISFSRGSSQPRDRTWVSCTADRRFTIWATREA